MLRLGRCLHPDTKFTTKQNPDGELETVGVRGKYYGVRFNGYKRQLLGLFAI
jgi:hypothetical protein